MAVEWSLTKNTQLGSLGSECTYSSTCTFTADNTAGTTTLQTTFGRLSDREDITIGSAESTTETTSKSFADDSAIPSWSREAARQLQRAGIMTGTAEGNFDAAGTLTRGQIITLIHRLLEKKNLLVPSAVVGACIVFDDVPSGAYMHVPACVLVQEGYLEQGGRFRPHDPATRGFTAALMNRILGATILDAMRMNAVNAKHFSDVASGDAHYTDAAVMKATGLMTGRPDGSFDPDGNLNRAEAAMVIHRAMRKVDTLKIKTLIKKLIDLFGGGDSGESGGSCPAPPPIPRKYRQMCDELVAEITAKCEQFENWSVDIQIGWQDFDKNRIGGEERQIYGPNNKCSSRGAGGDRPLYIKSEVLDIQTAGVCKNFELVCDVACYGWGCPEGEPLPNTCKEGQYAGGCPEDCKGICVQVRDADWNYKDCWECKIPVRTTTPRRTRTRVPTTTPRRTPYLYYPYPVGPRFPSAPSGPTMIPTFGGGGGW